MRDPTFGAALARARDEAQSYNAYVRAPTGWFNEWVVPFLKEWRPQWFAESEQSRDRLGQLEAIDRVVQDLYSGRIKTPKRRLYAVSQLADSEAQALARTARDVEWGELTQDVDVLLFGEFHIDNAPTEFLISNAGNLAGAGIKAFFLEIDYRSARSFFDTFRYGTQADVDAISMNALRGCALRGYYDPSRIVQLCKALYKAGILPVAIDHSLHADVAAHWRGAAQLNWREWRIKRNVNRLVFNEQHAFLPRHAEVAGLMGGDHLSKVRQVITESDGLGSSVAMRLERRDTRVRSVMCTGGLQLPDPYQQAASAWGGYVDKAVLLDPNVPGAFPLDSPARVDLLLHLPELLRIDNRSLRDFVAAHGEYVWQVMWPLAEVVAEKPNAVVALGHSLLNAELYQYAALVLNVAEKAGLPHASLPLERASALAQVDVSELSVDSGRGL